MHINNNENDISKASIIGYLNENNELRWKIHDRLVEFISKLPQPRQFPAICGIANDLENETAILILNSDDLKKTEWHNLEDYL